jgi:WD40 repeat protein
VAISEFFDYEPTTMNADDPKRRLKSPDSGNSAIGNRQSAIGQGEALVSSESPWPGLASFTEETRAFFHGRDQEVTELFRRVQRKHLTILFGQSGHGKSSLLRAGLVPKLRPEGYCPIYVRLDHTPGSLPLSEQIKERVFRTTAEAGTWTKPGASVAGESLWEFLHHRDDQLKEASGRTLVPLIIFDQFEEIFTLAQTDATGRARAEAFITDLADLVENRPPLALEEKLEQDPPQADRFDFDRADYRILITLREDYLPHLEALKKRMPSITQNRLRLSRLSGKQACESVLKTGGKLVTPDVAEAIVKFVSGAEDTAHAEVEPSLLSLVCRELNEHRRAKGLPQITADMLEGSRESILSEYYERTLAAVPVKVREFVEDELLTSSGFRESVGEERVRKAFADAGAPAGALAELVNQRLLRIEERLDVRRVEITHDVLCSIVKSSREKRLERLALRRARRLRLVVGALAAGLAVLVTGTIVFGIQARRAALEAAQRSSRSDFTNGNQLLEQGRTSEGLAFLARAAESDPQNYAVGSRLISALTARPFTVPVGPVYQHSDSTTVLGFSADGSRVITNTVNNTLSFWDVATARRIGNPFLLGDSTGDSLRDFGFDQTCERVAVTTENGNVRVFETATGRLLLGPWRTSSSPKVAFSPDGRWLVTGGIAVAGATNTPVSVWDARTGELRFTMPLLGVRVSSIDFNTEGTRLLVTSFGRQWHVWSFPDGQLLTPLAPGLADRGADGQANFGRFSPDGRLVIITDQSGAQLWDWASQTRVGQRMAHADRSDHAAFSPDARSVITASTDGTLRIWSVPSGLPIGRVETGSNNSIWRTLSRDGRRVILLDSKDRSIHVVDTATGRPQVEPLRSSSFTGAVFSPDEKEIWTSDLAGVVRRWRAEASAAAPLELHFDVPSGGAFQAAPDGSLLLRLNARVELRNPETGVRMGEVQTHPARFWNTVRTADGRYAAVVNSQGLGELWDYRQPTNVLRHPLARLPVGTPALDGSFAGSMRFSDDGTKMIQAFSGTENAVYVWDNATGRQLREFRIDGIIVPPTNTTLPIRTDLTPDGTRFAIADNQGRVGVWEMATGRRLGEIFDVGGQINSVQFSPDGSRVASTGNSRTLRLTDPLTGKNVRPEINLGGSGSSFPLRYSPDGRFLLVRVPSLNQLLIWDTSNGSQRTLPLAGIPAAAVDAAPGIFDPVIGRYLSADPETGTVKVFSLATGQMLVEPLQASGAITAATTFDANGRFIFTKIDGRPTFQSWPVARTITTEPVPAWLSRLGAVVAGGRINPEGLFQSVAFDPNAYAALKAELAALPDNAPYVKWGRWFLEDPLKRTINPESPLTPAQARELADVDPLARQKATETRYRASASQNWLGAEALEREILGRLRDLPQPDNRQIAEQLANLAQSLNGQQRFAEAERSAREALALQAGLTGMPEEYRIAAHLELGAALTGLGRLAEAEPELMTAWRAYTEIGSIPDVVRRTATALAELYRALGRQEDSARWALRSSGSIDL